MSALKRVSESYRPKNLFHTCKRLIRDHGYASYRGIGYVPNDSRTQITVVRYNRRFAEITADRIVLFPSTSFHKNELMKTDFSMPLDFGVGASTVGQGKVVNVLLDGQSFTVPDNSQIVIDELGDIHLPKTEKRSTDKKKVKALRERVRQFFQLAVMTAKVVGRGEERWRYDNEFLDAFFADDVSPIIDDRRILRKWDQTSFTGTRLIQADEIRRAADLFMNRAKHTLYEKCGVFE